MEQFNAIAQALGLNPALVGVGVLLALLLRYARGMFHGFTAEWTYISALLLGIGGSVLKSTEASAWRETGATALALTAFILLLQKGLEAAAKVVPWLPQDNEWTTPKEVSK